MGLVLHRPCRCGHGKDAHEHYRSGSDCSGCACARFHGQLEVTVRFGRVRPLTAVVVPEEVQSVEEPWVRPTHSAGLTSYADLPAPVPPLPRAAEPVTPRVAEPSTG